MSEHKDRFNRIAMFAPPPKGTPAYESFISKFEARYKNNPNLEKYVKESFNKAVGIIKAQMANGAGLPLDSEIRFFLSEYNDRNFRHGIRSLPTSFNILESFFDYHPAIQVFELLEEEDFLFSLFDFFDYLTPRNVRLYLEDILNASNKILKYAGDASLEDLVKNEKRNTAIFIQI